MIYKIMQGGEQTLLGDLQIKDVYTYTYPI